MLINLRVPDDQVIAKFNGDPIDWAAVNCDVHTVDLMEFEMITDDGDVFTLEKTNG